MDTQDRIWDITNYPQPQETDITLFAPTQDYTMKKPGFALIIVSVFTSLLLTAQIAWAQTTTRATKPATAEVQAVDSMTLNFSKVVPAKKQYVIYNSRGQKILDLKAGSSTAGVTDCAQIPCPPTFGDDVVCWKCVEQITSGQGSTE